jgi:hypothetical protein
MLIKLDGKQYQTPPTSEATGVYQRPEDDKPPTRVNWAQITGVVLNSRAAKEKRAIN